MKSSTAQPGPASRPLHSASLPQLAAQFAAALAAADGVAGAHCIHEWWLRGSYPAIVEAAMERLWQQAAPSIPDWLPMTYVHWLPLLYDVAGAFRATATGRSHVYLVLLDFDDRRGDPQGVYVGMSRYPAAQRFDQHKAGIRAAGSVLKRGIEVLTGPVQHLQFIARAEAARIERELACALAEAGLRVEGGH